MKTFFLSYVLLALGVCVYFTMTFEDKGIRSES